MHRIKRSSEEVKLNMTPMIDIVFQLIIFFVIAAEMEKHAFDQSIMLAFSPDGPAIEQRDPRTITIDINDQGGVAIAMTRMNLSTLTAVLRQTVAAYGASTPVHIRGDRNTDHEFIRRVLDACGEAGIWRVSFIALKESAAPRQ